MTNTTNTKSIHTWQQVYNIEFPGGEWYTAFLNAQTGDVQTVDGETYRDQRLAAAEVAALGGIRAALEVIYPGRALFKIGRHQVETSAYDQPSRARLQAHRATI